MGCYEQARKILGAHEHSQSAASLQNSKQLLGRIANAHLKAGSTYLELGRGKEAIHEFRKSVEVYPKLPDARLFLAKELMRQNNLELAKKELEDLCSEYPKFSKSRVFLGLVHFRLGNKHLAKQEWEHAYKTNPQDWSAKSYHTLAKQWPIDPPLLLK